MDKNNLNKIDKSSLSSRTYKKLKEMILSKKIRGKIRVDEIANKTGLSRTPVLYALDKLESQGFLTKIPYRGYFIKAYSSG